MLKPLKKLPIFDEHFKLPRTRLQPLTLHMLHLPLLFLLSQPHLLLKLQSLTSSMVLLAKKFLHQCNLFLTTNLYNDEQKVVFGLSYMKKGNALPWAERKMEYLTSIRFLGYSWAQFQIDVRNSFGDMDQAATARMKIKDIKQRTTVDEYIVWFEEYAALTGYNDAAKIDCLKSGLNSGILTKIYLSIPMPTTYEEWKERASHFDCLYQELQAINPSSHTLSKRKANPSNPSSLSSYSKTPTSSHTTTPSPTPIKVKNEAVDPIIAAQRKKDGVCIRCGSADHWTNNCPTKSSAPRGGFRGRGRGGHS
jgi:Retrotransposon gag protein